MMMVGSCGKSSILASINQEDNCESRVLSKLLPWSCYIHDHDHDDDDMVVVVMMMMMMMMMVVTMMMMRRRRRRRRMEMHVVITAFFMGMRKLLSFSSMTSMAVVSCTLHRL